MAESSARRPGLLRRLFDTIVPVQMARRDHLDACAAKVDAEHRSAIPPACAVAPSLDALHPAFVEPVTGYMVRDGFNRMRADPRFGACAIFMSPDVIGPDEARVEVEIRLRRVIPEGEA